MLSLPHGVHPAPGLARKVPSEQPVSTPSVMLIVADKVVLGTWQSLTRDKEKTTSEGEMAGHS